MIPAGAVIIATGLSVVGGIAYAAAGGGATEDPKAVALPEPSPSWTTGVKTPTPASTSTPTPRTTPRQVEASLRPVAPSIPEHGSGDFRVVPGSSQQAGEGHPTTYTVEVEVGLPFTLGSFGSLVQSVLSDPRGWTGGGDYSVQRVATNPQIRVLLATPATTDRLCAPLDTGGRLSCRNGELVVLNAWRWVNGARSYGDDLHSYRQYMINHEFGHALGNAHASCEAAGAAAPVMLQQTKGLDRCLPNPWPSE